MRAMTEEFVAHHCHFSESIFMRPAGSGRFEQAGGVFGGCGKS